MNNFTRKVFVFLLLSQTGQSIAGEHYSKAVIIMSGGAAISPFTTPKRACTTGLAAGSTDTFMREYLLKQGYHVFTAPAMAGYGQVPPSADKKAGPFGDCPKALPDAMTVNSTGDIQLAGVHLANFVQFLGREYGVRQVHFVAHSMGGSIPVRPYSLFSRRVPG